MANQDPNVISFGGRCSANTMGPRQTEHAHSSFGFHFKLQLIIVTKVAFRDCFHVSQHLLCSRILTFAAKAPVSLSEDHHVSSEDGWLADRETTHRHVAKLSF